MTAVAGALSPRGYAAAVRDRIAARRTCAFGRTSVRAGVISVDYEAPARLDPPSRSPHGGCDSRAVLPAVQPMKRRPARHSVTPIPLPRPSAPGGSEAARRAAAEKLSKAATQARRLPAQRPDRDCQRAWSCTAARRAAAEADAGMVTYRSWTLNASMCALQYYRCFPWAFAHLHGAHH